MRYCSLDLEGKLEKEPYVESRDLAPGRIIRIQDDDNFNLGILMLLDQTPEIEAYTKVGEQNETQLYTFPFNNQNKSTVTLYCVKMEIICPLISSSDENSPVSNDCLFEVMQLSRSVFDR